MNSLELGKSLTGYLNRLSDAGLRIEMATDFEQVPETAARAGGCSRCRGLPSAGQITPRIPPFGCF